MNDSERDMMLARIDENVLHLKATVGAHQVNDDKIHEALAGRLTTLELSRARQRGAVTTATTLVSAGWALLLTWLGYHWSK